MNAPLRMPDSTPYRGSMLIAALAVLVGVVAAYGALALIVVIAAVQHVFYGFTHGHVYSGVAQLPWWRVVLAPGLGGLLVGLVVWRWIPGRRNYGPADAMQAVHERDGRMSIGIGLGSAAVSALSIGAGASVGRYGPAVHLGASISAWLAHKLELPRAERLALLGSGVAAAIAASFNAPLAGVLFASEVMLGGRALRSFVPVTIAAVVGTAIARLHPGAYDLFNLSDYRIEHVYEYPLFVLTGVLGGLLSIAFMRGMDLCTTWVGRSRIAPWARPMVGGLLLGSLALWFPHIVGLGDEAIHDALGQLFPIGLLLALIVVKLVATSVSFGFGFSGGVFGPALYLGAMMGSALGNVVADIAPHVTSSPTIYAVAGMGAVISCVIGAPVTTILIAFELTHSYALTTAVMLSVVFAGLARRRLFAYSYFKFQLAKQGVDVELGREVQILRARRVGEVVSDAFTEVAPELCIARAEEAHLQGRDRDLLVVEGDGRLVGRVSLTDIVNARRAGLAARPVAEIATPPTLVVSVDMSLHEAMEALRGFVGISTPVVSDEKSMHLVGVIHETAVIEAYHQAIEEARREERGVY